MGQQSLHNTSLVVTNRMLAEFSVRNSAGFPNISICLRRNLRKTGSIAETLQFLLVFRREYDRDNGLPFFVTIAGRVTFLWRVK